MEHVTIIAEVGVNHNGSMDIAKRMIAIAADSGADYIKFQTFKPELLASRFAEKAKYQKETTGTEESQLLMLKKLALEESDYTELAEYANERGIGFISTPFDIDSIHFLEKIKMDFWKLPSGEITNYPYLVEIAKTGKPVVMSTGMSNMNEISEAIDVLKKNGSGEIALLHCNTQYPTPFENVNLKAMNTLRESFECEVGYSDHTLGIEVPIAAVAMGATIIEKHFTIDRNMDGPDHKASLEPRELKQMIDSIRNIEKAMGDGIKKASASELQNRNIARKSIVALRDIKRGEVFTTENITTKRPGNGISPMMWNVVLGKRAVRNFGEDELIEL